MHKSVQDYVKRWATELGLTDEMKTVIEFGSLNVNGSVRHLFKGEYIGVDMQAGPGVDWVMNSNYVEYFAGNVRPQDCVLWLESMEHDLLFWKTIESARQVLNYGGYLIVTTRGIGFPLHNYPSDYYRFTPDVFNKLFTHYGFEAIDITQDPQKDHPGVFGVFRCKPQWGIALNGVW